MDRHAMRCGRGPCQGSGVLIHQRLPPTQDVQDAVAARCWRYLESGECAISFSCFRVPGRQGNQCAASHRKTSPGAGPPRHCWDSDGTRGSVGKGWWAAGAGAGACRRALGELSCPVKPVSSVAWQQVGRSRCAKARVSQDRGTRPIPRSNSSIMSLCVSLRRVRDRCRQSRAVVQDACATVRSLPTPRPSPLAPRPSPLPSSCLPRPRKKHGPVAGNVSVVACRTH